MERKAVQERRRRRASKERPVLPIHERLGKRPDLNHFDLNNPSAPGPFLGPDVARKGGGGFHSHDRTHGRHVVVLLRRRGRLEWLAYERRRIAGRELGHRAMQAPAAGSSPLETGPKTIRAGFFLHERGNPVRQTDDGITGFLDGRNTGFFTYHGFRTIASLSRIISRDYYY
jgi:hypothetical protein